jgi:RNA polymerase sigma-70 factor (ECF subfamily)
MSESESTPASNPPPPSSSSPSQVVEHFFRHETGRLHGALTRLLGPGNLTLVEDVAQGALLQAMRTWSIGGVPPNPSAWMTRVAMNLARDTLRHRRMSAGKETAIITHIEQLLPDAVLKADGEHEIRDDALRLMFVCCHPSLPADAQVVLAL